MKQELGHDDAHLVAGQLAANTISGAEAKWFERITAVVEERRRRFVFVSRQPPLW